MVGAEWLKWYPCRHVHSTLYYPPFAKHNLLRSAHGATDLHDGLGGSVGGQAVQAYQRVLRDGAAGV